MRLAECLNFILDHYEEAKKKPLYGNPMIAYVGETLIPLLRTQFDLDRSEYEIIIRMKAGEKLSEIPRIFICPTKVCKSEKEGYFIGIYFKSDLTGIYLSINQGFDEYRKRFPNSVAKIKLKRRTMELQSYVGIDVNEDMIQPITLGSDKLLSNFYSRASVLNFYYPKAKLESDSVLRRDFRILVSAYETLYGKIKKNLFGIPNKAKYDNHAEIYDWDELTFHFYDLNTFKVTVENTNMMEEVTFWELGLYNKKRKHALTNAGQFFQALLCMPNNNVGKDIENYTSLSWQRSEQVQKAKEDLDKRLRAKFMIPEPAITYSKLVHAYEPNFKINLTEGYHRHLTFLKENNTTENEYYQDEELIDQEILTSMLENRPQY